MAWNWERIGAELMAKPGDFVGRLNQRMKALENHLGLLVTTLTPDSKVYTTDATVTTVKTITIPVSTTLQVAGRVTARRTGGSGGSADDGAGYRVEFAAKNAAGTAALIAAATVTVIAESQAAWTVTVTASGGNVLIRVTGAANNNVTWVWTGQSVGVDDRS